MFDHPFVLMDADRAEQFRLLGCTSRLFLGYEIWIDPLGIVWGTKRVGGHCFAVSLLGPSWVFDRYGRERRAQKFAEAQETMKQADAVAQRQQLDRIISGLKLGRVAERVLYAIHQRVMQAKRSVVRIPSGLLASAVWGPGSRRPRHWRKNLQTVLEGLMWLHVAGWPEGSPPMLGEASALITHVADLKRSKKDGCDNDCPQLNGPRHDHFLVNIGRGFLGILEQLAQPPDDSGVRVYNFRISGRKNSGPTLRTTGKTGKLTNLYLPAKIGAVAACRRFTSRQHRLLAAIVRETTRFTKRNRRDLSEAETISGNRIRDLRGKKEVICELLAPESRYAGFNGSKLRKGLGYRLTTPGGWLAKAGYAIADVVGFFADLAALANPLGLIPVGIRVTTRKWLNLGALQALAATPAGRRTLSQCHLRIYTAADYVHAGTLISAGCRPSFAASGKARIRRSCFWARCSESTLADDRSQAPSAKIRPSSARSCAMKNDGPLVC